MMHQPRLKTILLLFTIFLTLLIILPTAAFFSVEKDFASRLDSKKFLPTTEYFSVPTTFRAKDLVSSTQIETTLAQAGFRKREPQQILFSGDFTVLDVSQCLEKLHIESAPGLTHCYGFVNKSVAENELLTRQQWILVQDDQQILETFEGLPLKKSPQANLEPQLLAQYSDGKPIMQQFKTLSEIPPQCLNAVMSIEDSNFLEHSGFSFTGILRALYKNIVSGRRGQGGSTITQQLVKNYFLTSERSFRRKATELIMAVLLESKYTKDEILETYLNIIYMGQNGPFQVIGYGAAAPYYFGKPLEDLNLPDCALLAAVLNGPGVYDPWQKKEKSLQRRNLVLSKMQDLGYINDTEMTTAQLAILPVSRPKQAAETAPYYFDAVRKQLNSIGISTERAKIYTFLNLQWQQLAQDTLQKHLQNLETNNKYIHGLKLKGLNLEGVVLAGDPKTGAISVAVGGRSFRMTQFNRAVDGHRQVGSIIKPFVFLTALQSGSKENPERKFTPLTLVSDEKFQIEYDKQKWSPDNYSKKYYGQIPLFYALKNSLNASTATLGLEVGLDRIIDTVRNYGVTSALKPLPSLILGAFEMYPVEVLRAYMGLSQLGQLPTTTFVMKVTDKDGQILYEHQPTFTNASDPVTTASLVSMMKQTVLSGTARFLSNSGFTRPTAGKTGTTSDYRDTWFAGFTPFETAVIWVGYDNNTPTKLTGSSGAVPVWFNLMKEMAAKDPPDDFVWPEGSALTKISHDKLKEMGGAQEIEDATDVDLVFRKGEEP